MVVPMSACPATSWAMCGGMPFIKLVESNVRTMLNGVSWKRADDAPVLVDALDCCSRCNIRPLNATGSDATPWDLMQPVVDIPGHGRCPALRHAEPASG